VSAQTTDTPSNSTFFEDGAVATNITDWATHWIENVTDSSLNQTTTTMLPTTVTSKTTLSSTTSTSTQ
ncbi:anaphase-promoting complex subunit cdh1-like isoform X2, partial [Biomphalaria pfeifferi]